MPAWTSISVVRARAARARAQRARPPPHPYLGKFIPQLVEALLERYVRPGGTVLDPFAGSGTTLVQSLESGRDAVGGDIAAFNCLLMRVKTARYNEFTLEKELRDACARLEQTRRG